MNFIGTHFRRTSNATDKAPDAKPETSAFSRTDLLVVIGVVVLLGGLAATFANKTKGHAKEDVCLSNLKELGTVIALYEHQDQDKLPLAAIQYSNGKHVTWDTLINPFMRASLRSQDLNKPAPGGSQVEKFFTCPFDTIPSVKWGTFQPKRRTYSMPYHNMWGTNWPPGPNNSTGIGLHWSYQGKGNDAVTNFSTYTNGFPAVRLSMIQAPDDTMLLTERPFNKNILANSSGAYISRTSEHMDTNSPLLKTYHEGRYNYLMIDGHAEALYPDQTVGFTGATGSDTGSHRGLWTIKSGD